jgi:hypothetical protein
MIVPPPPSSLLAKPFVGAGEGSDEFDDGGFVGLERDPVGPLGTPTAALEREKKAEALIAAPKRENRCAPRFLAQPCGCWAPSGARKGAMTVPHRRHSL